MSNPPAINITIGASFNGINEAFAKINQTMQQFTEQVKFSKL